MPADNFAATNLVATRQFSVMTKPVGPVCNLDCDYCYYKTGAVTGAAAAAGAGAGGGMGAGVGAGVGASTGVAAGVGTSASNRSIRPISSLKMSARVLENFIRQYIEASPGPNIFFTWHGGEPALAGLDFYRAVVKLQNKYTPEGWECINNLQTNGLLLDDEWCSFLSANRFDIGLSLDGAQWLHDAYRKDRNGAGSYIAAAAAVRRLLAHGVRTDLLCTVTPEATSDPLAVYSGLRSMDTGWVQFIPIVRRGADGLPARGCVSPEGYGTFLCDIFDEWISHDLGRLDVQIFVETARVSAGWDAGLCRMAPTCGRVLIVEQDGSVYSCDHYVYPEYKIGNIESARLGELVELPEQRRFGDAKHDSLPAQCLSCQWLKMCNGGCPKDRFAYADDGAPGLNYLCNGLKQFFAHSEQPLKQLAKLSLGGMKPDAIMYNIHSEAQAKWKGVGRNDPCPCGSGKKAKNCCMKAK